VLSLFSLTKLIPLTNRIFLSNSMTKSKSIQLG
jgi:hypothetical protein